MAIAGYFLYDSLRARSISAKTNPIEARQRGADLFAQGHFAEAVTAYQRALEASDDPATRKALANAFTALGSFSEAGDQYRRILAANPRDGLTWYEYADLLRAHIKDYRGAQEAYRFAIDFLPRMPEAHFNLGLVLLELREPEDAAAAIESSLSLAPPNAPWRQDAENALLIAHTQAAARSVKSPTDDAHSK